MSTKNEKAEILKDAIGAFVSAKLTVFRYNNLLSDEEKAKLDRLRIDKKLEATESTLTDALLDICEDD